MFPGTTGLGLGPISSIVLLVVPLLLLLKYHWNRLDLYKFSWKCNGPRSWPVIGSALSLRGTPEGKSSFPHGRYLGKNEEKYVNIFSRNIELLFQDVQGLSNTYTGLVWTLSNLLCKGTGRSMCNVQQSTSSK